jgi:hypothetical protein
MATIPQEAPRDRERELSQFVDMVPIYLWRLTPDGGSYFFDKRLTDVLGLNIADAHKSDTSRLAAFIETVIHPDDAASLGGHLWTTNDETNRATVVFTLPLAASGAP